MQSHDPHIAKLLSKLNVYLVYFLAIVVPLIFLPFVEGTFDTPKILCIVIVMFLTITTWTALVMGKKELVFSVTPFFLPQISLIIAVFFSAYFAPTFFTQSLYGVIGTLALLEIFSVFAQTVLKEIDGTVFLKILLSVSIVLTLITFLQIFGVGPSPLIKTVFGLSFASNFQFSPTGSPLITVSILIPILLANIAQVYWSPKWQEKIFEIIGGIILTAGILTHVFFMLPNKPDHPQFLSVSTNWFIATQSLPMIKQALFGFGPNGFADAFTLFRPVTMNDLPHWNVIYQVGSNTPLTLFVSTGAIGMTAWLFLFIQCVRTIKKTDQQYLPIAILTISTLFIQFFIPFNIVLLTIQTLSMIVWAVGLKTQDHHSISEMVMSFITFRFKDNQTKNLSSLPIVSATLALLCVGLSGYLLYFFSRGAISEYYYYQSFTSLQEKNGNQTYQHQQRAVRWAPYRDDYRRAYAKTNFALADSLSNKKDISDQDRTNIVTLMQQSVREARVAAQLNPNRSQNWSQMGEIYKSLIGTIKDADQFAVGAYVQAIQKSPTDPSLRLDLGGIFMKLENYQQAADLFHQAIQLKPDYANGYYNYGKALERLQLYEQAKVAYEQTLHLVEDDPNTITQLNKDIDTVNQAIKTQKNKALQANPAAPAQTPDISAFDTPQTVKTPTSATNQEMLINQSPEIQTPEATPSGN